MLADILARFPNEFHQPDAIEPLSGGQSLVQLHRLTYSWGEAVLKGPLQAREWGFYQQVAPKLAEMGIAVPQLFGAAEIDGERWVMREAFPELLPTSRWVADAAMSAYLHAIHALPTTITIPDAFIPRWEPIAPEYHEVLPETALANLARLDERHRDLFAPSCVTTGDPNASNWGLREDGTMVLFDWDRVGYGTPAHDLAVSVPGMGYPTIFEQVAAAYLALDGITDPQMRKQLAHDCALAKVAITIDYINTRGITEANRGYILASLPSWSEMIAQMDEAFHRE